VPDYDDNFSGIGKPSCSFHNMFEHSLAANRLKDFRQMRIHPFAEAGCQDNDIHKKKN